MTLLICGVIRLTYLAAVSGRLRWIHSRLSGSCRTRAWAVVFLTGDHLMYDSVCGDVLVHRRTSRWLRVATLSGLLPPNPRRRLSSRAVIRGS